MQRILHISNHSDPK